MRTWLKIVAWVVAIVGAPALLMYLFFFDVWTVPADDPLLAASIQPTLGAGDIVLVTRRTWVDRGNLLRCADPETAGRFVVARAIGRAGDNVAFNAETVSLDGQRTPSPRACEVARLTVHDPRTDDDVPLACSIEEYGDRSFPVLRSLDHPENPTTLKVEPGRWFLVSDDRHIHLDSRDYGLIDPSTCQHVVFRLVGAAGFSDSERRLNIIW
ncbi:MAG: signal peptidase I [Myxococcota bacterium]|nr:signal peptidase I [Myxococcota bacterium]